MQQALSRAEWKKSSYSGNTGNCVEVADLGHAIAVRDSKDSQRAVLVFSRQAWQSFIASLRADTSV